MYTHEIRVLIEALSQNPHSKFSKDILHQSQKYYTYILFTFYLALCIFSIRLYSKFEIFYKVYLF